jgi:hypothetical protein
LVNPIRAKGPDANPRPRGGLKGSSIDKELLLVVLIADLGVFYVLLALVHL